MYRATHPGYRTTRFAATTICALIGTAAAHADLNNFAEFAPVNIVGRTASVGISADKATLTLTDGGKQEAASAWDRLPQPMHAAFTATFVYQASRVAGPDEGDGFAFVVQNDPRGAAAVGDAGRALGYGEGGRAIARSVAVTFNLFNQPGEAVTANGAIANYSDTSPVDFGSGHPIRVKLDCDGSTIEETLRDETTGDTFSVLHPVRLGDLGSGETAFVGFTGASGAVTAMQTIRDFRFVTRPAVPLAKRRKIVPPPPKVHNSIASYVDPLIGTSAGGNTYPGAVAPFGMVQFSPDTRAHSIGYMYGDRQIQGFSLTHMSGVGCDDYGDVFLTASTGEVKAGVEDYSSPFSHRHEVATPGYYEAELLKPRVDAELTATTHAGIARFTFPAGQIANVIVPISHTLTYTDHADIRIVGDREIEGEVTSRSFCGSKQTYTVYFVMRLDQPFALCGTFIDALTTDGSRSVAQAEKAPPVGAYVSFPESDKPRVVNVQIGISFVDSAGARTNLEREVAGRKFDDIRRQTAADWERELRVAEVQGGTEAEKTVFYTSLYHCLLMPNIFNDSDGRYIGFDKQIHQVAKGHAIYANYSGWDIYRTEAPLLALIAPDRMRDMCESIALMYRQGGWIDRWPQANTYTNVMCGSPLTTVVATAWNYGIRDFDIATAYEGMYRDATQRPPRGKPYFGEDDVADIDKLGYLPDDKVNYGSVSQTEEDCIAYAALGTVARSLGKTADAALLTKRALCYRNLFDPETKFLRPKLASGAWYAPFNPTQDRGYVEGSGWHYRWLAPQDVAGLIHLFGGDDAFNTALDQFFAYDRPSWSSRYYNPYNEPDLQAPFLYDYSGTPWKTQAQVRKLLSDVYNTMPAGIPGNDDCGTMSAWCVFAMLGLYPTDPARPDFELCSPVFSRAILHLSRPYKGKTLTIEAQNNPATNAYIREVSWNYTAVTGAYIGQGDLVNGGKLTFGLQALPNKLWGAGKAQRPPSQSQ